MTASTVEKPVKATASKANKPKTIQDQVKANGGIVKITLSDLRDELGFARLGKKVLTTMAEYLAENSLGYFPGGTLDAYSNPEPRQWQEVWIYERDGSAKSAVLDAVSDPDAHDLVSALSLFAEGAPNYKGMDDGQRLAVIRAVVCK